MQRDNYDKKTLYVFDTIGTYFINIFYNGAYQSSHKRFESGAVSSLTDAYRNFAIQYINGIKNDREFYITVINKLHEYYHMHGGVQSLLMSDFEDIVVSKFIPAEYFSVMTSIDKDRAMHEIVSKTIGRFVVYVLDPQNLRKIIDDRGDRKHVLGMQEHITHLFMVTREEYVSQFVDRNISEQDRQTSTVNKKVFDKLKTACVSETKKRMTSEQEYLRAINIIKQLATKIKTLESAPAHKCDKCDKSAQEVASLTQDIRYIREDYDKLSRDNDRLQKECAEMASRLLDVAMPPEVSLATQVVEQVEEVRVPIDYNYPEESVSDDNENLYGF